MKFSRKATTFMIPVLIVTILGMAGSRSTSALMQPEATLEVLETRVAELEATATARSEKISAQQTQIAVLEPAADALPLGQSGGVGNYDITISSVVVEDQQYEDLLGDPVDVPRGRVAIIATLRITYGGGSDGFPYDELYWTIIAGNGRVYKAIDDQASCEILANDLFLSTDPMNPGDTLTGDLCWLVLSGDADFVVLQMESLEEDASPVYFSLRDAP